MYTATDLQQAYDEGMAAGRAECEALRFRAERLADQAKREREVEAAEAATKLGQYGQGKIPLFLKEAEVASLGQVTGDALHPNIITLADNALSVLITGSILAQTQGDGTSMAENICRLRAELAEARAALMAQAPAPAAPPAEHQGAQGG